MPRSSGRISSIKRRTAGYCDDLPCVGRDDAISRRADTTCDSTPLLLRAGFLSITTRDVCSEARNNAVRGATGRAIGI